MVFDAPLAIDSPGGLFNVTGPGAHAEAAPPAEQPSNDNETNRSVATAMLTARQRPLLKCTAITSFAQRLLRSFSHFFTYSLSRIVLVRESVTSGHVSCRSCGSITRSKGRISIKAQLNY